MNRTESDATIYCAPVDPVERPGLVGLPTLDAVSQAVSLSERNPYEVHAELVQRLANLEAAVLLLAKHVGAVGWNYELQQTLNLIRDAAESNRL